MKETQAKRSVPAITAGVAGVALAACAACCAPLLAPLVAWLGLSGFGMAATGWYAEIAILAAVSLGGFLFLRHRRVAKRSQACHVDGSCGCGGSCKS